MADFFQNGVITTLQNLKDRPIDELEYELRYYSEDQKICLLLPALYSEFEGPAMPVIVEELKKADYLHKIILSLDQADERQYRRATDIMGELPCEVSILWNDGPRLGSLFAELEEANFDIAEQGKGRGVWLALGLALADKQLHTIALHDCDIVNYQREMLARLIYPIVHPGANFEFSKGYYVRVEEKLYGRVTRLFVTPLIRSLRLILGDVHFLHFLDSFRYPLSGEFAFIRSLARGIRISPTWGLEVSLLGEVFDHTTVQRVCQVEIADAYHHKHQDLSKDDPSTGLVKMATDIATTLFGILAEKGNVLSKPIFDSILASYLRFARIAIEQFNAVALINGLEFDRHEEIEAVESYAEILRIAEQRFQADPIGAPLMASWTRIRAALPEFPGKLADAVLADRE